MKKGLLTILVVASCLTLVGVFAVRSMAGDDVPRIPKEKLKAMLGTPGVVVLDVRSGSSWKASDAKIRGAIRENPAEVTSWSGNYTKDQTLVLYCS